MHNKLRGLGFWTAAVWATVAAPLAPAQDAYPARPVRMVAPFPPGGSTDVLARVVAQKLSGSLGRQVVVENRPGAAGNIGHEVVAKAPPDGYTLLLSAKASLVTNPHLYKQLPFDPLNDFAPISLVATAGSVLVVHPSVPAHNVKQLIALARARPGVLNYGSGGIGGTYHVVTEVFMAATGTRIVHVPYKGGGVAVTDLVAGNVDLVFADMVPAIPQIRAGRVRALAVTSGQRQAVLPEVPTMAESGVKEPFPENWWALNSPKGTPAAIIKRLNTDLGQVLQQADVKEKLADLGVVGAHSTPEQVQQLIRRESPQMARILKEAGVKPE
jgi:tripartite-type tricarboxylate transporter receptor subunit TctC